MPEQHAHALVVGFRKADVRRAFKIPRADTVGGKCISCSQPVYVNAYGADAIRRRDADVVCLECEKRYGAQIDLDLIES